MSEVKLLPCPFCGSDVNDDNSGHAESCYFTAQDNFENSCGGDISVVLDAWNSRPHFDAQRLRADTAEAGVQASVEVINSLHDQIAAAEQRIAELGEQRKIAEQEVIVATGLLRRAASEIDSLASSLENACEDFEGEDDEDPQASGEVEDARSLANRIRAALNPNPEAESHEAD